MPNQQSNRKSQSAIRELSVAELDAVSGARLGSSNSSLPGPSPTFPPIEI
jgi:hypothetical protein